MHKSLHKYRHTPYLPIPPLLPAGAAARDERTSQSQTQLDRSSSYIRSWVCSQAQPQTPNTEKQITTYSNSGRPKSVKGRMGLRARVGDWGHTCGGAGEGTALPGRRHPPPSSPSSGRPRVRGGTERSAYPKARGWGGEQNPGPRRSDPSLPECSHHARPQQAPVLQRGQGEGDRTPRASRVDRCGSHSARRPSSVQRGPDQGLSPSRAI